MFELFRSFFLAIISAIVFWTCVAAGTGEGERVITDAPARAMTALHLEWMGVAAPDEEAWDAYHAIIVQPREYTNQLRESLGGGLDGPPDWPQDFSWPYDELPARRPVPDVVRAATLKALTELDEQGFFADLRAARKTLRPVRVVSRTDGQLVDLLIPELGDSRRTARHVVARMHLALDENDQAPATGGETELIELVRDGRWIAHTVNQGVLIGSLVSIAIDAMLAREVAFIVREHELSDATLAALDAIFAEADPTAAVRVGLQSERQMQADMVQRCYTDDGKGNGYLVLNDDQQALLDGYSPFVKVPLHYGGFWAALPFASRRANDAVFDSFLAHAHALLDAPSIAQMDRRDLSALEESLDWHYPIARILIPATSKGATSAFVARAEIDSTRLIIAIRRHTLAHGQPPKDLAALVPAFLTAIPADALSGMPWVYRALEAKDAEGQRFILYSVGADRTDNGGQHAEEARTRLRSGTGKDYVFNRPRD